MSETPGSPQPGAPMGGEHPVQAWLLHKLRRFWPVIPLALILFALMLSDLGDFTGYSPLSQDPCVLTEADQSSISAKLYLPIAKWALRYTPTPSVAMIYIDPAHDPADLLTNVCASRAFLGRLVTDLNAIRAQVVVIDKYYGANSCAETEKNTSFVHAMESSTIPVVVGQQTHGLESDASGCLALTPRLEFSKSSNVRYGITRLNNDDLKIPLRWPVFTDPADTGSGASGGGSAATGTPTQLPAASGDTLSLAAAKAVDPNIESNSRVAKMLAAGVHPYTTFLDLPHITALTAMCSAESSPRAPIDERPGDDVCKGWAQPLDNLDGKGLSLAGKIVVIGDLSDLDMRPFPTDQAPFPPGMRPGVFLQANYVQALLDHRFLFEIPMFITVGILVLYVLMVYAMYWAHDENGHPRLTLEQAGLWSLTVLAVLVAFSFVLLVTTSYFTPLWALWGAGVFMVFKYLEAAGHHRSMHLLGHLAKHKHPDGHAPAEPPAQHEPDGTKHS